MTSKLFHWILIGFSLALLSQAKSSQYRSILGQIGLQEESSEQFSAGGAMGAEV